jgi:Smg protein
MFDILIFLFESYFDAGSCPDPDKLSIKLLAAGFEDDDIRQAINWLSSLRQLTLAEYPSAINKSGFRFFADLELQRISEEGLQFIIYLEFRRIIVPIEREMIIDRVISLGHDKLSLDKVKLIVLMVLWNQHEELNPLLIEELLTPSDNTQVH